MRAWLLGDLETHLRSESSNTVNAIFVSRDQLIGALAVPSKRLDAIEGSLANIATAIEAQSKAPVRPIYAPVLSADWESLQAKGLAEFEQEKR